MKIGIGGKVMIKILDNWEIDSDGSQYILRYNTGLTRYDKKQEKDLPVYKNTTYHPSVEMALKCLANKIKMGIVESEVLTVKEAIKAFKEVNREMENILKGVER